MKKTIISLFLLTFLCLWFSSANSNLEEAVSWMHSKWLTIFDNPTDFMAEKSLRRDEASKFFVQYAKEVMWLTPDTSKTSCNFTDLNQARPDLKDLIIESCQLWLFQWHNWKFMPTQSLTNAQAITVLIRMIDGQKDESQWHFWQKYFEKAQELRIMEWLSLNSTTKFDKLTTRWDIGNLIFNSAKLINTEITDLFPLDLVKNQKWTIEFSVPKRSPYDYWLVFRVQRDWESLTVTTKEKNEITWRLSDHKNKYRAWFTYKKENITTTDYNSPILELSYCYYLYPNIQVDFRCDKYYVDIKVEWSEISWRYLYFWWEWVNYVRDLFSTYDIKIINKSNTEVESCKYKWETYKDYSAWTTDKIYHSENTKKYKELSNFICFETETAAKRAWYKASLLNN